MNEIKDVPVYKVALIGKHDAGKTSIIAAYHTGTFSENTEPTVGANFVSQMEQVGDQEVEIQLWDTAGQDKYRAICPLFYRDAVCCICVYDCTSESSFFGMNDYISDYHEFSTKPGKIFIACNKIDLEQDAKFIELGKSYARDNGFQFFAVSAKTNEGIKELFREVTISLLSGDGAEPKDKNQNREKDKSSKCC